MSTSNTIYKAALLEQNTGIPVLRHSTKKPGVYPSIIDYFNNPRHAASSGVTHPSQIVIVGDRLFTDVMMANMMGSWSVWVRDGVVQEHGLVLKSPLTDPTSPKLRRLRIELADDGPI